MYGAQQHFSPHSGTSGLKRLELVKNFHNTIFQKTKQTQSLDNDFIIPSKENLCFNDLVSNLDFSSSMFGIGITNKQEIKSSD